MARFSGARWPYRVGTFVLLASAWQIAATSADVITIPTFTATLFALLELVADPRLWVALIRSNEALVLGFAVVLVIGIPTGLAMGRFRFADRFTDVYINILLMTPMAALIPLLIMSTGIGLASRLLLIVFFSVALVVVNVRAGVRDVDPHLIQMARSFGATERQVWTRVLLPGSAPAIMSGIRLGLGQAINGMVAIELLMVAVGVGGLILEFRGTLASAHLYAMVFVVIAEALLLIRIAGWAEARLTPWART